ncbi:hypothetical protein CAAN1_13S04302 [[Candida] anglica]|uniref:Uncharacterized protein n=1 Tax=[Candida] anglica TaxID=148631 RepID=A0ABP0EGD6_9ASCO
MKKTLTNFRDRTLLLLFVQDMVKLWIKRVWDDIPWILVTVKPLSTINSIYMFMGVVCIQLIFECVAKKITSKILINQELPDEKGVQEDSRSNKENINNILIEKFIDIELKTLELENLIQQLQQEQKVYLELLTPKQRGDVLIKLFPWNLEKKYPPKESNIILDEKKREEENKRSGKINRKDILEENKYNCRQNLNPIQSIPNLHMPKPITPPKIKNKGSLETLIEVSERPDSVPNELIKESIDEVFVENKFFSLHGLSEEKKLNETPIFENIRESPILPTRRYHDKLHLISAGYIENKEEIGKDIVINERENKEISEKESCTIKELLKDISILGLKNSLKKIQSQMVRELVLTIQHYMNNDLFITWSNIVMYMIWDAIHNSVTISMISKQIARIILIPFTISTFMLIKLPLKGLIIYWKIINFVPNLIIRKLWKRSNNDGNKKFVNNISLYSFFGPPGSSDGYK